MNMDYQWTKEHYEATQHWVDAVHKLGDTNMTEKLASSRFKLEQWSVEQIQQDTIWLLRKSDTRDTDLLLEIWSILGPNFRFNETEEKFAVDEVRNILKRRMGWVDPKDM